MATWDKEHASHSKNLRNTLGEAPACGVYLYIPTTQLAPSNEPRATAPRPRTPAPPRPRAPAPPRPRAPAPRLRWFSSTLCAMASSALVRSFARELARTGLMCYILFLEEPQKTRPRLAQNSESSLTPRKKKTKTYSLPAGSTTRSPLPSFLGGGLPFVGGKSCLFRRQRGAQHLLNGRQLLLAHLPIRIRLRRKTSQAPFAKLRVMNGRSKSDLPKKTRNRSLQDVGDRL